MNKILMTYCTKVKIKVADASALQVVEQGKLKSLNLEGDMEDKSTQLLASLR